MSNRETVRDNLLRLEQYIEKGGSIPKKNRRKLTVELSEAHHDLLNRLAILENDTRTGVLRRALDLYANEMGEENIYPY